MPGLRVPALIIRGEHPEPFPSESMARMERLVGRAHFVVIPGAGHLVPMERPADTGVVIQCFLGGDLRASLAGSESVETAGLGEKRLHS